MNVLSHRLTVAVTTCAIIASLFKKGNHLLDLLRSPHLLCLTLFFSFELLCPLIKAAVRLKSSLRGQNTEGISKTGFCTHGIWALEPNL